MRNKAAGLPFSEAPSWDGRYALLVRSNGWYGDLEAYCDHHGRLLVDQLKLATAAEAGRHKGRFVKLALPPKPASGQGSSP